MGIKNTLADFYVRFTGYTYSNMARLFLRLFVGIMFMQFGIRHLVYYHELCNDFPSVFGMQSQTCLILMIVIELVCSLFIMVGFLTRLSTIPPIVSMIVAENYIIYDKLGYTAPYLIDSLHPGYLPIMFIGIYLFILLAGPGKISLDYFVSLMLIARRGRTEADLEEV